MKPISKAATRAVTVAAIFGSAMHARADDLRMGILSNDVATFCVNTGAIHEPALSPFPADIPGTTIKKIQISVSQAPVAVSNGDLDMAECAGPSGLVLAWLKGAKNTVMVFVGASKPPYVLVGGKDIKSLQDMRGKVVGSPGLQSTATESSTTILMRGANLAPQKDYRIVSTGTGGARAAALAAGKIDAIPTYPPFSYRMTDEGFNLIGDQADYVPHYVLGTMIANRAWADAHRAELVALIKTFLQTGAWIRDPAKKEEVIASFAAHITEGPGPMGEEHARRYYKDIVEGQRIAFDGYAPREAFMSNLEIMAERGALTKDQFPPLKEIVDYSFLNQARKELGMAEMPPID